MAKWTADVTNDPNQDFDLVVELLEDGEYRARVKRCPAGEAVLQVYEGPGFSVPLDWLRSILSGAVQEVLPANDKQVG